jgi:hypothetical protein
LQNAREAAISGIWAAFPHAGDRQISAVQSLQQAASHEELRATLQCVSADLLECHSARFIEEVLGACARAVVPVGFTVVEESVSIDGGRVVAMREDGCALVTEIAVDGKDRNVTLSSEVVGAPGAPGECTTILARHDEALTQEGVRCNRIDRHPTGGRPQLEAARAVARRLARRLSLAPTQGRPRRPVATSNRSRTRS